MFWQQGGVKPGVSAFTGDMGAGEQAAQVAMSLPVTGEEGEVIAEEPKSPGPSELSGRSFVAPLI